VQKAFNKKLASLIRRPLSEASFLIAASGGRDSMVLLDLMSKAGARRLAVAHFNHGLRGNDSQLDEKLVKRQCHLRELTVYVGNATSDRRDEASLRRERLAFLEHLAEDRGFDFIVTGHQANDALETFVMRLIRGTGTRGLGAIPPRRKKYVRPLLTFSRQEITDYARGHAVRFREDESNTDRRYFRNQIRHTVIPAIVRSCDRYGGERLFLKKFTALTGELRALARAERRRTRAWIGENTVETPYWIWCRQSRWQTLSLNEQGRVLRFLFSKLGNPALTRSDTRRIRRFLTSPRGTFQAPGKIHIDYSLGVFFFSSPEQRRTLAEIPSPRWDKTTRRIEWHPLGLSAQCQISGKDSLVARRFRPGDFQGATKLKSLFLEMRIPRPERALLAQLVSARSGETLWFFPQSKKDIQIDNLSFAFSFLK